MSNARVFVHSFVHLAETNLVSLFLHFHSAVPFNTFRFRWLRLTTGQMYLSEFLAFRECHLCSTKCLTTYVCVLIGPNCRLSRSFRHSQDRKCLSLSLFSCCNRVLCQYIETVEFSWIMSNAFRPKGLKMSIRYMLMHTLRSFARCGDPFVVHHKIFKLFPATIAIP